MTPSYRILVHGGAVLISDALAERSRAARLAGVRAAAAAGNAILADGGIALDAVEAAVRVMESDPVFNAGEGGALTIAGTVELDATVMSGRDLRAAGVATIRNYRHPVTIARRLLDSRLCMILADVDAENFACSQGLRPEGQASLITDLARERASSTESLGASFQTGGTVGAVALDMAGDLAAATSSGGMPKKPTGRIADSAIMGLGTYASNASAAVVCTGHGESIMRVMLARDVAALMEFRNASLSEAAIYMIDGRLRRVNGRAALVALDRSGKAVVYGRCAQMPWCLRDYEGRTIDGDVMTPPPDLSKLMGRLD